MTPLPSQCGHEALIDGADSGQTAVCMLVNGHSGNHMDYASHRWTNETLPVSNLR